MNLEDQVSKKQQKLLKKLNFNFSVQNRTLP